MSVRIALGGPMAVGKSTVGAALAAGIGVTFVDLDLDLGDIAARFKMGGEGSFRDAESAALRVRAAGTGVIALGGGTLVRPENRALLQDWTVVILLATETTLEGRIRSSTSRPLAPQWRALLEERRETWSAFGPPIWTDGLDTASVVDQVLARCSGAPSR